MTLVKFRNNGDLLKEAFVPRHFASLVDTLLNDNFIAAKDGGFHPAADLLEAEQSYELHLSLPGFRKEDVKIELDNNKLTISGERKRELQEGVKYVHTESMAGKFSRSFNLPKNANQEGIQARFENGILYVTLAKSEQAKPKSITIE